MAKKKLWAHYEQLIFIIGLYITLFFSVPLFSLGFSSMAHMSEIESKVQGAVKIAVMSGLKWYVIIMPIITFLFFIWFLRYSDTVEFTASCIKYHPGIYSKKFREISYENITQVVFCDGLWMHSGEYYRGRKILVFNKKNIIFAPEISPALCLSFMLALPERKIWLVNDNSNLRRVGDYFKIDFMKLTREQQLKLLKFYCKVTRVKYKTGEEILKKGHK